MKKICDPGSMEGPNTSVAIGCLQEISENKNCYVRAMPADYEIIAFPFFSF